VNITEIISPKKVRLYQTELSHFFVSELKYWLKIICVKANPAKTKAWEKVHKTTTMFRKYMFAIYLGANHKSPTNPFIMPYRRNPFTGFMDTKRRNKDPTISPMSSIASRIPK
jgi:hypothetical protein